MSGSDFLDGIGKKSRPEPNATGSFDCQVCEVTVGEAHYDKQAMILRWWCPDDHESIIKEFQI